MAWQYHQQSDLSGGENRNLRQVAPNQLLLAFNTVKAVDGSLRTRLGKTQIGTFITPGAQTMLRFQRDNGTESLAIQSSDRVTVLTYDGSTDPTFKSQFMKTITDRCHMVFWRNRLLLTNTVIGLHEMLMDPEAAPPLNESGSLSALLWAMNWNVVSGTGTNSKVETTLYTSPVVYDGWNYSVDPNLQSDFYYWRVGTSFDTALPVSVGATITSLVSLPGCLLVNMAAGSLRFNTGGEFNNAISIVPAFTGYSHEFTDEVLAVGPTANSMKVYLADATWEVTVSGTTFTTTQIGTASPPVTDVMISIVDEADGALMGTCLAIYGERLYIGEGDLLKCSDLADPETFDVLNVISVGDGDGDRITALIPMAGGLVICKRNSTWVLYGDSYLDWQLTRAPIALAGAANPWAVACDGQQYLFVGRDNIYSGTLTAIQPVGQTHAVLVQNVVEADRNDTFVVQLPQDNGRIVIVLGGTNTTLNIETKLGGITTWTDLLATTGCAAGNSLGDDDGKLLIVDESGILYKMNGLTDFGTKIQTRIIHGYENFGTDRRKQFRRIIPKFGAETLGEIATVMISRDIDYRLENTFGDIDFDFKSVEEKAFEHTAVTADNFANVHGALEMHSSRGHVMAAMFSSNDRIIYTGYTAKYREVGAW